MTNNEGINNKLFDADLCATNAEAKTAGDATTIEEQMQAYRRTVQERVDALYQEWEELSDALETEKFCEDCSYRRTAQDFEEFWGAPCVRDTETCPAEFEPDTPDCPRRKEYISLDNAEGAKRKELKAAEAELAVIEGFLEPMEGGEKE